MRCEEKFYEIYQKDHTGMAFCPYRICPIGAHSDHNLGKITGLAVDQGIHMAYRAKRSGIIEVRSLNFPTRAQWHVGSPFCFGVKNAKSLAITGFESVLNMKHAKMLRMLLKT